MIVKAISLPFFCCFYLRIIKIKVEGCVVSCGELKKLTTLFIFHFIITLLHWWCCCYNYFIIIIRCGECGECGEFF